MIVSPEEQAAEKMQQPHALSAAVPQKGLCFCASVCQRSCPKMLKHLQCSQFAFLPEMGVGAPQDVSGNSGRILWYLGCVLELLLAW